MGRKRFNSSHRQTPSSERSYYSYQFDAPAQSTSRAELVRLIKGGEDTYLEVKVRFSNSEKLTAEIIALANTAGGAMIFGVNDQLRIEGIDDPELVEEQLRELCLKQIQPPVFPYLNKVAFDSGRRVVVLEIESHNRPHRSLADEYFLREGAIKRECTREELSQLYGESPLVSFEQAPVFRAHCERDIDESLFWSYVRGVNPAEWGTANKGYPTANLLRELGLAVKRKEELIPTVSGLLLFGLNERVVQLLPQASLQLTRFSGTDTQAPVIERVELTGNLLRLFDGALHFLQRYVDLRDERPARKTIETAEPVAQARANFSRAALSSALVNLLVHRAWQMRTPPARIHVFDDSIELLNPCQLRNISVNALRYGVKENVNPRLHALFCNPHYGALTTPPSDLPTLCAQASAFAKRAPDGPQVITTESRQSFRLKLYGLR